ncbi:site-2 protease family protein [Acidicapsa dinghuensis]|uniref:Site-2 protease family protein n=1 Tax=Acidicapsa dinghuensis TaxID=2218256 RepID=A0ABW1EAG9_9BACT|nr:site-2 protease family protein [Acidicapsa dinghuensis]
MQFNSIELLQALYQFVILIFSISCHECAHAWMASRLGDYTAQLEGRVTINPMRHIDLAGTLLFPALMLFGPLIGFGGPGIVFGWGKPVPVITRNLKRITRDDNLIAIAGPIANLILVALAFFTLVVLALAVPGGRIAVIGSFRGQIFLGAASAQQAIAMLGRLMLEINLALFLFNFLPIAPLDAARIVRNLLPYNALNTFDTIGRFGFVIIFILGDILIQFCLGPAMGIVVGALSLFIHA